MISGTRKRSKVFGSRSVKKLNSSRRNLCLLMTIIACWPRRNNLAYVFYLVSRSLLRTARLKSAMNFTVWNRFGNSDFHHKVRISSLARFSFWTYATIYPSSQTGAARISNIFLPAASPFASNFVCNRKRGRIAHLSLPARFCQCVEISICSSTCIA